MNIEQFTAVAMCPSCGEVAVHPFRLARHCPPHIDPASTVIRRDGDYETHVFGGVGTMFDPAGAAVVRQCRCGTEWAQR